MTTWTPHGTTSHYGHPPIGRLVAYEHAVWRVTNVTLVDLTADERDQWIDWGMPDAPKWKGRPADVAVTYIGGVRPDWATDEPDGPLEGWVRIPASRFGHRWDIYPESERWPQCSCCGEPMPCRAELQDQEVATSLTAVEKWASRTPGSCWACGEQITRRQRAVTYDGDNLDLPGGPTVRFHTRAACFWHAQRYELRWIAQDPRRERVLTYPRCGGILVVHGDGTSECQSGTSPLTGTERVTEPDCRGHLTHDHGMHTACYVGGAWMASEADMPGCPRGCRPDVHPGTRTTPRPQRRDQAQIT